jgi:hypothetical protein
MAGTSVAAVNYFNSILGNSLAMDENNIQQSLFDGRSSVLLGSLAIAAIYERKELRSTI